MCHHRGECTWSASVTQVPYLTPYLIGFALLGGGGGGGVFSRKVAVYNHNVVAKPMGSWRAVN